MRGITATAPIMEIEKRRVRQNPFVAYPKMIAQVFLPARVYAWLKTLQPRPGESPRAPVDLTGYAAADFYVSSADLRECINLVAICESD